MDEQEYLAYIQSEVSALLRETTLANYKNQIFAWRLNASFIRSFTEDYLWNRAIFLSSNCCYLLQNDGNTRIINTGLKNSAEIFEYLSELEEITEQYDKDWILLLSALCYDLSGYQANGYCIATQIGEFSLEDLTASKDLSPDNYIVRQITNILLKKLPLADSLVFETTDLGVTLFDIALKKWFENIFKLSAENDYLEAFEQVYIYYLNRNNIFISHLLFLLKTRIKVYGERSLWQTLKPIGNIATNETWRKYIKLLAYDYYSPNSIKDINDRKSIFELWTSQQRAIEHGLLEKDENFVIQMPTSAGKTFIAELSILKHLTELPDKKCIYVAPFRALTSEKEIELSKYFSKLGYSVSALSGSYEVDSFQDVILSQTDLLIATPEKIDLLLRVNPEIFNDVSLVVIDEGHIIGEVSSRASLLEFLIIRLKMKIAHLKTLFISAVMPPENANEYSEWLSSSRENVLRSLLFMDSEVTEEWEPTRKLIGSFSWNNSASQIGFKNFEEDKVSGIGSPFIPNFLRANEIAGRFPSAGDKPQTTAALAYKLSTEGNTLVFCAQPRYTKTIATRLLQIIDIVGNEVPEWFADNENKESFFYAKMWYGEDDYITKSIRHGIGVHFGDMPEQVRNSVENDYRNGKLKILLSSNTVGQGLNFPIKNLIFYSLQLNQDHYLSKRDFWNIVGRAGRAGKETEGKIIFILNTVVDIRLYNQYTDKSNLEEADSLFYKVIRAYKNGRLSKSTRNSHLSLLSETFLLDMFSEEIIGTDYEQIINEIIDNSLFKIQIEKRGYSLKPIKNSFRKSFRKFEERLSPDVAAVYKLSGFSFESNKVIDEFITAGLEDLQAVLIDDDYITFLRIFFEFVLSAEISELSDYKLNSLNISTEKHFPIIQSWVDGTPLNEIITNWKEIQSVEHFHLFLSKGLFYLYPWAFTAFLNVLAFRLKLEADEIPENIKNLSSYMKYGLNDATGCLARSLGIKNRDVVNILLPLSNHRTGSEFIKWLSNLSSVRIRKLEISEFDKENILSVCRRLTPRRFNRIPAKLRFEVQGIDDRRTWRNRSRLVEIGEILQYQRRTSNDDPYGIYLLVQGKAIGRLPAEYSKVLSAEIDIEDALFEVTVIDLEIGERYTAIMVELVRI